MAYLVLLFSLVGMHLCLTKIIKVFFEIKTEMYKLFPKKRDNEFFLSDYVNAQERLK